MTDEPTTNELEAVANEYNLTIGYNLTFGHYMVSDVKTNWPLKAYGRYEIDNLTPEQLEADIEAELAKEATITESLRQPRRRSPVTGRYLRGE